MTGHQTGWLQGPLTRLLRPLMNRAWNAHITGLHNVPATGPAIITPNHLSFIDSVIAMTQLPRRTLAVGKAEYMDDWKTRHILPAAGMIPLDRSGGAASEPALELAQRSLEQGHLFLIYPEGTRTRTGHLRKGRTGAARLALATGAPIIPVGLRGTDEIQPIDAAIPRIGGAFEMHIGKPIYATRFADGTDDRSRLRQITDEIMYEISKLSGQSYVDSYANEHTEYAQAA